MLFRHSDSPDTELSGVRIVTVGTSGLKQTVFGHQRVGRFDVHVSVVIALDIAVRIPDSYGIEIVLCEFRKEGSHRRSTNSTRMRERRHTTRPVNLFDDP